MKKNIQVIFITGFLTILLWLILKDTKEVLESVSFSISIWKDNLFPSLFPFLIISYLLTNYGVSIFFSECIKPFITNVLHLPASCGFTLIASFFSGFPSNSKFIKEQLDRNEITLEEANYLLSFCHFSSPLFVLGTIGTLLLGNIDIGILILLCHYIGNLFIALLFRPKKKKNTLYQPIHFQSCFQKVKQKIKQSDSFAMVLKNAIMSALDTLFLLLGIITIFLVLTNLITNIFSFSIYEKTIFSCILEMTQGVKSASLLNTALLNKSLFMLATISFGGLSVHTQIFSILGTYKISYKRFFISRILQVLFSCLLLFLAFAIMKF